MASQDEYQQQQFFKERNQKLLGCEMNRNEIAIYNIISQRLEDRFCEIYKERGGECDGYKLSMMDAKQDKLLINRNEQFNLIPRKT